MFEPLWNNKYIESVQLTIAEQLGVEERGEFYDITGALRDMVQNHLMQMLCMTAMEAPASLDADAVRDEKVKVIKSLKPLTIESVNEKCYSRPICCSKRYERLSGRSRRTERQFH